MSVIIVISMTAFTAQAETTGGNDSKKTEWIFRIGPSFNNRTGDYNKTFKETNSYFEVYENLFSGSGYSESTASLGSQVGLDVSIAFNRAIGLSGLYWGMEAGLASRGQSTKISERHHSEDNWDNYDYKNDNYKVTKTSLLLWNVKLSPSIGYKYKLTKDIRLDAHLGAFVSYDLFGKSETKVTTTHVETDVPTTSSTDKSKFKLKDFKDFSKIDAGAMAGIGVWWKRFNLDFAYQRGFINMNKKGEKNSAFSSNFIIRLGYRL